MSLLTKKRRVEPTWSFRVKGLVWRVVSADSGMLVGEDRDPEAKRVSFFGLNRLSGKVLWRNVALGEPWWISIEATHRDRVFLHGFTRPDMPDHQRILALDLMTGRLVWSRDDVRYLFAVDNSVFTSSDSVTGRTVSELDLRSGSTLHSWEDDVAEMNLARARAQLPTQDGPEFPLPLDEMASQDERLGPVQTISRSENVVGPVEVLIKGNSCVFSYHEKGHTEGLLRNILSVIHLQNGLPVFAATLGEDVLSVAPDTFFVQDGMLYYVQNRSTLVAVNMEDLA